MLLRVVVKQSLSVFENILKELDDFTNWDKYGEIRKNYGLFWV